MKIHERGTSVDRKRDTRNRSNHTTAAHHAGAVPDAVPAAGVWGEQVWEQRTANSAGGKKSRRGTRCDAVVERYSVH